MAFGGLGKVEKVSENIFEQELELERTIQGILTPVNLHKIRLEISSKRRAMESFAKESSSKAESIDSVNARKQEMVDELKSARSIKKFIEGRDQEKIMKQLGRLAGEIGMDLATLDNLLKDKTTRKAAMHGMRRAFRKVKGEAIEEAGESNVDYTQEMKEARKEQVEALRAKLSAQRKKRETPQW